ncbi:hypothetical protein WN943_025304 [Citrus x changshan-huyou]
MYWLPVRLVFSDLTKEARSIQILTSPLTDKVCPSKGTISSFTCSQGATRHMTTQKKSMMEIESIGAVGKYDIGHVKKYFRVGKIFDLFLCRFVAPIVAIHVVCHVPRNIPATFALKRSLVKTMANARDLHTCTMHALVSSLGIIVQRYYQFGFCCCIKILAVVLADFDFWCKYFAAGEM